MGLRCVRRRVLAWDDWDEANEEPSDIVSQATIEQRYQELMESGNGLEKQNR
jgi:hypothetical protein